MGLESNEFDELHRHGATMICIPAAIKLIISSISRKGQDDNTYPHAVDRAWSVLLDLDTESLQEVACEGDEVLSNSLATAQACAELSQQQRSTEAVELQQLIKAWVRSQSYVLRHNAGDHQQFPAGDKSRHGFSVVPLSEQHAVLALLFALRGSCPAPAQELPALPALGSDLLKHLQQEAQAATQAASCRLDSSGSSLVPMSANAEVLLSAALPAGAAATSMPPHHASGQQQLAAGRCAAAAAVAASGTPLLSNDACARPPSAPIAQQQQQQQQQDRPVLDAAAALSWASPAAITMQMLQHMPLNPAADAPAGALLRHQQGREPPDDILLAVACGGPEGSAGDNCVTTSPNPNEDLAAIGPLLQCMEPFLQQSASTAGLGRPLLLHNTTGSGQTGTAVGQTRAGQASVAAMNGRNWCSSMQTALRAAPETPVEVQQHRAVSVGAAEAAAAVQAAAAVRPAVASLMRLSSQHPGCGAGRLLGQLHGPASSCSSSPAKIGTKHMRQEWPGDSDAVPSRDACRQAGSPLKQQSRQQHDLQQLSSRCEASEGSSRQDKAPRAEEAELVMTAHLALQGVWSAVQQLWETILQGCTAEASRNTTALHKRLGLCRPAVQRQLIIQVLHAAELRLRLTAFVQHFKHTCNQHWAGSPDMSCSSDGHPEVCGAPVLVAFVNAVQAVLEEQDAALAVGQQLKLNGQQQHAATATLLQLLTTYRGMVRQLQVLAELCWCTLREFVDCKLHVKSALEGSGPGRAAPAPSNTSSTLLNWQTLQQARGSKRTFAAAAAALQGAAAAAYEGALPWPSLGETAAAVQVWWAPSTWQLRNGFMGGYNLLEQLYAGVLLDEPDSAPLFRHLFGAAVQPVLHSLHSWALMPDTAAAEAAAEAAAMASFTAGRSRLDLGFPAALSGAAAGGEAQQLTAHSTHCGPIAVVAGRQPAVPLAPCAATPAAPKAWFGSKAAEASVQQCLQNAWEDICQRELNCPHFLAHAQQPARVAGMQLHLLQLLGGAGQCLANRLGWLAELEQQELQEVLAAPAAQAGSSSSSSLPLAASKQHGVTGLVRSVADRPVPFMGLLCNVGAKEFGAVEGRVHSSGPVCSLSAQQLQQCAAITADYQAAREAEVQQLLQQLAEDRAAHRAAHALWLSCRQEERHEAAAARARLEAEAAARRKQRQQQLLAEQQEHITATQARRTGLRQQELVFERELLQQAALQEHQQALQQLHAELHACGNMRQQAGAVGVAGMDIQSSTTAAAAAAGDTGTDEADLHRGSWGMQLSSSTATTPEDDAPIDAAIILLDVGAAAGAAGAVPSFDTPGVGPPAVPGIFCGGATTAAGVQTQRQSAQQQQEQQQPRQRGTWGPPVRDIAPAAGAPSGQGAAGPLLVVGSALEQAAAMPAAGRRSSSQPKVLPGMGRPVSLSRRNSLSDEHTAGSSDGRTAGAAGSSSAGDAAGGAVPTAGFGGFRAGRSSGRSAVGSILGGFGAVLGSTASGARLPQHGLQPKGKWGMPIVPGPAAGMPSSKLQRRASTGALAVLDVVSCIEGSSREPQQAAHQPQLQRQPSGGLGYSSAGWGGSSGGSSSRPSTPQRAPRLSEQCAAGAADTQRQQGGMHSCFEAVSAAAAAAAAEVGGIRPGDSFTLGPGEAEEAAGTGWLRSRHHLRPPNQGNIAGLDWLVEQAGYSSHAADASNSCTRGAPATPTKGGVLQAAAGAQHGDKRSDICGWGRNNNKDDAGADSKGTAAAPAASVVATLDVLAVQPLLAQHRLTTRACWSLLLHEHRLLQRLRSIQGLFFQQQGDWVVLLCEALEPLLTAQQQQQQQPGCQVDSDSGTEARTVLSCGSPAVPAAHCTKVAADASAVSPVVLQLLLESAVQQSCLADVPEAERMSLQAVVGRPLAGWSSAQLELKNTTGGSTGQQQAVMSSASATDCLLLGYDAPWPISLLLGEHQLQQYADVFSVLLRLRRLQQLLMKQWQPLNHRASSGTTSSRMAAQRSQLQRHVSERGVSHSRAGSGDGAAADPRRATWHGMLLQQASKASLLSEPSAASGGECVDTAAALKEGLRRLQQVRRWHAQALHCISSLLGYMLGELSGQQQVKFDEAVGSHPVSLPVMLDAHSRLLDAARQVCFLPRLEQQQQLVVSDGDSIADRNFAAMAYALVMSAWQLQHHIAGLLHGQQDSAEQESSSCTGISLAKAPSGFREGASCTGLVVILADEDDQLWQSLLEAGKRFDHHFDALKRRLHSTLARTMSVGYPLAGLAARLGVQSSSRV